MIFCGSGSTAAINKLVGRAQPAHPGRPRRPLGPAIPHPARTSARSCSSAPTSTTPTSCRGASPSPTSSSIHEDRDGHIDLAQLERELVALRGPAAADRLVLGRVQRDRHRVRHARHLAPAPPSTARSRSATSRRPRPTSTIEMDPRRATRLALQGRGVHLRPTSSSAGPGTPGRARRPPGAVQEPRARRAGRRHRRLRQPRRARLPRRHRAPRGGRHARHRRSRSAPASCSSSRRRSASTRSASARRPSSTARSTAGSANPAIEILGNHAGASACRSCRSSSATAAGTCTTTSWWRCSTTCSASSRAAAARAPGRTATGCWASTSRRRHEFEREIARGCEGIKPGWVRVNFNYFISEAVFEFILDAVDLVATEGWRLLPDYAFEPATGLWRHRGRPPGAAAVAARHPLRRRARWRWPSHRHREPESRLAEYLAEARELLARPPRPLDGADHPGGRRRPRLRGAALVPPAGGRGDGLTVEPAHA